MDDDSGKDDENFAEITQHTFQGNIAAKKVTLEHQIREETQKEIRIAMSPNPGQKVLRKPEDLDEKARAYLNIGPNSLLDLALQHCNQTSEAFFGKIFNNGWNSTKKLRKPKTYKNQNQILYGRAIEDLRSEKQLELIASGEKQATDFSEVPDHRKAGSLVYVEVGSKWKHPLSLFCLSNKLVNRIWRKC